MTQHAGLDPARRARFSRAQQVLSIASEMQRASTSIELGEVASVRRSYERVLNLVDLTVAGALQPGLRRELLRWRELVAERFIADACDAQAHRALLRCLLSFTPESARQVPYLAPL